MATKLNAFKCESDGTGTPEHIIRWADQSGQGHAPTTVETSYSGFTGASFTVDGNTNTSTTIDNLTSTGRIVVGMTITGTDIPGGTTVASIVSATSITISQAATGTTAGVTFTFNAAGATVYDPVIRFGYNLGGGGNPVDATRGQAGMQIEGHYDRGSTGDVWMEAFFTFKGPGATAAARPFFFAFDKETNEPLDISLAPGLGESLNLDFEDFTGGNVYRELTLTGTISVTLGETVTQATSGATGIVAVSGSTGSPSVLRVNHITGTFNTSNQLTGSVSGALGANSVPTAVGGTQDGTNYEFSEGLLQINPKASQTNFVTTLRLEAHENFGSTFRMGTNGQTEMFKMNTGVSSTTGYMAIQMKDNAGTPDQKTGQFVLQAEPSNESIMCSIGGALASHSILNVTNASGTAAKKVLTLICITSQTAPAFEIDGTENDGTPETDKFQIYPKGYISVKPSGGASSSPTAGSGGPTALPSAANKPNTAIGSATVTWFPMLDTSGALFWVPGWSD